MSDDVDSWWISLGEQEKLSKIKSCLEDGKKGLLLYKEYNSAAQEECVAAFKNE